MSFKNGWKYRTDSLLRARRVACLLYLRVLRSRSNKIYKYLREFRLKAADENGSAELLRHPVKWNVARMPWHLMNILWRSVSIFKRELFSSESLAEWMNWVLVSSRLEPLSSGSPTNRIQKVRSDRTFGFYDNFQSIERWRLEHHCSHHNGHRDVIQPSDNLVFHRMSALIRGISSIKSWQLWKTSAAAKIWSKRIGFH